MRFLKGVIDSEDLPLNISRQALQDNALVAKIRRVMTKRFLKFLAEQAKQDEESYISFWKNFGIYLKEGITSDFEYRKELGDLVRFESSKSKQDSPIALAEYVLRMNPDQEEIYYINGPNRAAIEAGPYIEMFRKKDVEILYTMEPIDDFVLSHLGEFDGKKLVSADRADISLDNDTETGAEPADTQEGLAEAEATELQFQVGWGIDQAEFTINDEGQSVTEFVCNGHIMGGKEDRFPIFFLLEDQVFDPAGINWVQSCCRFIQEEQIGLVEHGAGNVKPVFHSF